jgi:hypothetical protein
VLARLLRLVGLAALALGCVKDPAPAPFPQSAAAPSEKPAASAPPATVADSGPPPAKATEPSEVLVARVEAAMKAVALFDRDFAGLSAFHACIVLFDPQREWVFQCPDLEALSQFEDGRATFRGGPIFGAPTLTVPGQKFPYDKVKGIVGRAGGVFRLPPSSTETPFFLIQDLDALRANHPAFTATSTEDWIAIFVHEYFHVFQFSQPAIKAFTKDWHKEWPQREGHSKFFSDSQGYRDAVAAEVAILSQGLSKKSKKTSKTILSKWLTLRKQRMANFKAEFEKTGGEGSLDATDGFFTMLEGTARYIEVRFLCEPALPRPDLNQDPSFHHFDDFQGCGPTKVSGRDKVSGDFHYLMGMLVATHLDVVNPSWKKTVFSRPGFLVAEAQAAGAPLPDVRRR